MTAPPEACPRVDIANRDDIAALLRDFYGRAFRDDLLGPVFVDIARMDLDTHLPVMCDFWETVLFRAGTYHGNALRPHQRLHARAGLTPAHFARWLTLWRATVDDRHCGPNAEQAKLQATRIAGAMSRRITGQARIGRLPPHIPREIVMSHDTVTSTGTRESRNARVIEAIRDHHSRLAAELDVRTNDVLAAARDGDCAAARDRLQEWYRDELLPHIVAEEKALYSRAGELDATRLLICGMLAEHRALVALIADLALAQRSFEAATVAASARALLRVHLNKENDLLLPALDLAGLDLGAALAGMHEILGHAAPRQKQGCGCGCVQSEDISPGTRRSLSVPRRASA